VARTQLVRLPRSASKTSSRSPSAASPWGAAATAKLRAFSRVGLAGRAPIGGQLTYTIQAHGVARALAADPKLLLFDEWLAGLNPNCSRGSI
jgi:branched-chain amino acid transport system ATP-binding protein